MARRRDFTKGPSIRRLARFIEFLGEGVPLSIVEIAERDDCSRKTAGAMLHELRARGLARIAAWPPDPETNRYQVMKFGLGAEPDEPRPAPMDKAKIAKRYRKRVKRDRPDQHMISLQMSRARGIRPYRDPMIAAFFGPAP